MAIAQRLAVLITAALALVGQATVGQTLPGPCLPTPPQTEGPYYPVQDRPDKDHDLTQVKGRPGRAKGQVIYIRGQVRDAQCRPIAGVVVEIWQAAASGRYDHPRDRNNPAPPDPDFQYWGITRTDEEGRYLFKTIKPGPYPAGPGWIRPSHVHVKVHGAGTPDLTTQLYFAGDPHHDADRILAAVPPAERPRVIVELESPGAGYEPEAKVCQFDLTL